MLKKLSFRSLCIISCVCLNVSLVSLWAADQPVAGTGFAGLPVDLRAVTTFADAPDGSRDAMGSGHERKPVAASARLTRREHKRKSKQSSADDSTASDSARASLDHGAISAPLIGSVMRFRGPRVDSKTGALKGSLEDYVRDSLRTEMAGGHGMTRGGASSGTSQAMVEGMAQIARVLDETNKIQAEKLARRKIELRAQKKKQAIDQIANERDARFNRRAAFVNATFTAIGMGLASYSLYMQAYSAEFKQI